MKTILHNAICVLTILFSLSGFTQVQLGLDIDGEVDLIHSGKSVSLSSDGNRMAVGAPFSDINGFNSGHVRIYEYDGTSWSQVGASIDGASAGDRSGWSVSLSSDGSRVAIGATLDNNGGATNSGHVRVFEYNGTSWTQLGEDINGILGGDQSGWSISLSSNGSRVAIGSLLGDGNMVDSGDVRVFEYSGTSWSQLGADIDGEATNDVSGRSVSLSSDGNKVAIGATGAGTGSSGHVRIYEYNGASWSQLGTDIIGEAPADVSGWSVSLNSNGNIVAIGAQFNDGNGTTNNIDIGHVRIYEYNGTTWSQLGTDIDGEELNDYSGISVSLNSDGNLLAIGATGNDENGSNSGHVRIYNYDGMVWSQLGSDIDGETEDDLSGGSVSLSADGTRVAIGAEFNDGNGTNSGHVRVYDLSALLSISDLVEDSIFIGPNPIKEELLIHVKENSIIKKVQLFDVTGKLVINTSLNVITTAHLLPGIYVITISTNKGSYSKKLIKN